MKKYKLYTASLLLFASSFISCDDFLDETPDNRATIDTEQKVTSLLASAYPTTNYAMLSEMTSDNTDQIAGTWTAINKGQEECATWNDMTYKEEDSVYELWNSCYKAIAAANMALSKIEEMGNPKSLQAEKGEALMCRAYSHFILTNIFCKAYSTKSSKTDLGIPYSTTVETTVFPMHDRGTVAEDYELMKKDIDEALPLMDDVHLSVPKYHFNKKAAYAFAARFYLYYVQDDKSNYQKVIDYTSEVLTENPVAVLRDWKTIGAISVNYGIRSEAFTKTEDVGNLLLYSTNSLWSRIYDAYSLGCKYCHNTYLANTETCKVPALWGTSSNFYYWIPNYQGMPKVIMGKMTEFFEYTDIVNGIGICHVVFPAFTTDEAILNRAEAYAMIGKYSEAINDMNTWMHVFTKSSTTITQDLIDNFYGDPIYNTNETTGISTLISGMEFYTPTSPTSKKEIHPDFEVSEGSQRNIIYALLHMRRILTLHEGLRWFDVKRYGIEIYRRLITNDKVKVLDEMKVDDPRRAIQLPQSVITAGLEANPRNK